MGNVLGFGRHRRGSRPVAAFGLVTELVDRDDSGDAGEPAPRHSPRGRMGVIQIGEQTTVCRVEHVPSVGDLIHGEVAGVVERVRIGRDGRISIFARPADTPEPLASTP